MVGYKKSVNSYISSNDWAGRSVNADTPQYFIRNRDDGIDTHFILKKYNLKSGLSCSSSAIEVFDLSDEVAETNINKYLVLYLYAAVIVISEIVYKLSSESFKELFTKLQRGDAFI